MLDLDPLCEVGVLPGDFDRGAAVGGQPFQCGGLTPRPDNYQGIRNFTVEFVERRQSLYLEGVFLTPFAVGEGETHLLGIQYGLNNAVDIHLVPSHQSVSVGVGLLPLNSNVAEVTGPTEWKSEVSSL